MKTVNVIEKLNYKVQACGYVVSRRIKDQYFKNYNDLKFERMTAPDDLDLITSEKDDCVVLSMMSAADAGYRDAHTYCSKVFNRRFRKGVLISRESLAKSINCSLNGYKLSVLGVNSKMGPRYASEFPVYTNGDKDWTVQRFIENHQVGRYVIIVKGHALAVIDGVLHGGKVDQYYKPSQKIYWTLKMEK